MDDPDVVRASDSDRDAVVERLREAATEGRLTLDELPARIETVYAARTHGELARVTADLPERRPASPAVQRTDRGWMVTVFGDATRDGVWRAQDTISPVTVFGDVELDLRQATMPTGEVAINATAPFGDIEVFVPEGTEVDLRGFTLFGHKKLAVRPNPGTGSAPRVRVRAYSIFGNVKVWAP